MNKIGLVAIRRFALSLVAPAALAQPPAGARVEIPSCASGPPISMSVEDERAVLSDDERDSVLAEMTTRYPMLERDGFSPAVIVLWHKAQRQWLYVSLQPLEAASGTLCFTASFVAEQFRVTPDVMRVHKR